MKKILYLIPALLLFAACNKTAKEPASEGSDTPAIVNADGTIDEIGVETVATGNAENLNDVDFKIKVSNKALPKECGIAYSTNLTDMRRRTAWRKKADVAKSGEVSIKLDLLYTGATYYYAAYSIYEGSCYYGEVKSLTTPKAAIGNAVYMGLSVDWSDRNLGANSPKEAGNIYCWADVNPAGATCDLYSLADEKDWMDKTEVSDTEYDAVKAAWGGRWRLPTKSEMQELALKCKWEIVTLEGVKLFKVTPKKQFVKQPYIYIPITGVLYNGPSYEHDEFSPTIKETDTAYLLTGTQVDNQQHSELFGGGKDLRWCYALEYDEFDCGEGKLPSVGYINPKYFGYNIRPVYVPEVIN